MERLEEKIDGLKELFTERFDENSRAHTEVWEQVKMTNGRVRLLERVVWGIGGAMTVMALLFSPSAVSAVLGLIK